MSRKTKRIVFLSAVGVFFAALITAIVLLIVAINSNPLVGKWNETLSSDSIEFFEDGRVTVSYNNRELPIIETPYSGTIDGTYRYDKSDKEVSITLEIYSKEITTHYYFEKKNDVLSLTDSTSNKTKTYSFVEIAT